MPEFGTTLMLTNHQRHSGTPLDDASAFHTSSATGNQGTHHEGGLERFLLDYGAKVGCRSLNDAHAGSKGQGRVPI